MVYVAPPCRMCIQISGTSEGEKFVFQMPTLVFTSRCDCTKRNEEDPQVSLQHFEKALPQLVSKSVDCVQLSIIATQKMLYSQVLLKGTTKL